MYSSFYNAIHEGNQHASLRTLILHLFSPKWESSFQVASLPLQEPVRMWIYFYVRASGIWRYNEKQIQRWDDQSVKDMRWHQPSHKCPVGFLILDHRLISIFVPSSWAFLTCDRVQLSPQRSLCPGWDPQINRAMSYKYTWWLHEISQLRNLVNIYSPKWRLVGYRSLLCELVSFCFRNNLHNEKIHSKHLTVTFLGD